MKHLNLDKGVSVMSKEYLLKVGAAALIAAFALSTANAGQSHSGNSSSASASGGSFASASVGSCCDRGKPDDGGKKEAAGTGTACPIKSYSSRSYKWIVSSSSECGCTWKKSGGVTKWMCPVRISSTKRK